MGRITETWNPWSFDHRDEVGTSTADLHGKLVSVSPAPVVNTKSLQQVICPAGFGYAAPWPGSEEDQIPLDHSTSFYSPLGQVFPSLLVMSLLPQVRPLSLIAYDLNIEIPSTPVGHEASISQNS